MGITRHDTDGERGGVEEERGGAGSELRNRWRWKEEGVEVKSGQDGGEIRRRGGKWTRWRWKEGGVESGGG